MKKIKYAILLLPLLILAYSYIFEPINLEITNHEVTIGTSGKSLIVAHLSDLHTKGLGSLELKVLESILFSRPDIIIITGDITTPGGTAKGYEEVLLKLKAPLGVYFVQGNWEYWEPVKELKSIFKKAGILDLTNQKQLIKDDLWLVGLDDELAGYPSTDIYMGLPVNGKIISMYHSPALFKSIYKKTDLAFAGHSHGGQIRIPFIGPIWTPDSTDGYVSGWFEEGNAKMYVSRGLGNSILPIRFNCRPEVAFIKINY